MKKKIFAIILTVCMIMTMIPMNAFAAGNSNGETAGKNAPPADFWMLSISEEKIDENDSNQRLGNYIRIAGQKAAKDVYLYAVHMVNEKATQIVPVNSGTFEFKYKISDGKDGSNCYIDITSDNNGDKAIEITQQKDNCYKISIDNSKQKDYDKGTHLYSIWLENMKVEDIEKSIDTFNSTIDTNTESARKLVFSTRNDLKGDVTNKDEDFGFIDGMFLTREAKDYKGYFYIANIERAERDDPWEYKSFAEIPEGATFEITYTSTKTDNNGREKAQDLMVSEKNTDGTYTIRYSGKKNDTNFRNDKEDFNGYWIELKNPNSDPIDIEFNDVGIAPVSEKATYDINFQMLQDPADYKGELYDRPTNRMWVSGIGNGMQFAPKILEWETCFYVTNRETEKDAREVINRNNQEERFCIGNDGDFVVQVSVDKGKTWTNQDAENQAFTISYIGYKKGFENVFKITLNEANYNSNYHYRLHYKIEEKDAGKDPYLSNGNKENSVDLELYYSDYMAEFTVDEACYEGIGEQGEELYNIGNLQYFKDENDYIMTRLVVRPDPLVEVMNKTVSNPDKYIYIEGQDKVNNIKICRHDDDKGLVEMNDSPFEIEWVPSSESGLDFGTFKITYAHPEKDIYGPWYTMRYEDATLNELINSEYGLTGNHEIYNNSSFFTGKFTVEAGTIDENNRTVNAKIADEDTRSNVSTIGVIFGTGSISGSADISVETDKGNITFKGSLVDNISKEKTSFEMRDVLKNVYGLSAAQKEVIKKCEKAFDFKITDKDQNNIDFGKDGYAEIEIPCDIQGMAIYYIDENGNKTLISSTYENGKIKFTAKHFSTYVVAPYENTGGSTSGGGTVMPPAADEDDVKTTTDNTTSEIKTSTTIKDTKTETVKNEQGQEISKVTAKVSEKTANNLVDAAVSNKSDTVEITVKSNDGNKAEQTEVEIPKKALESIAKDTEADLVIKTDNGQVILDNRTLETIAAEAEGDTVRLVVNENAQLKEEQKPASDVIGDNGKLFDLKAVIGDKVLHDFRGGKAHVTLPMPEKLKGKDVVVIYINDKGICEILNHTMETIGAEKYIKFTTSHFSNFAVVEKADAEKIIDKQNADKINSLIREAEFKATTSNTSKKNVRVKIRETKSSNSLIKEAKAMGYTVKYKYYRSAKKSSKYKAVKTKTSNSFINTKGKKGIKNYYKAKVLVYDGKKLVAQTELKQCSYGARTWNK